jgi:hypothetical protein
MTSPVHWIEIDLLRAGRRFPPVAGRSDYVVVLKRGDQRPMGDEATEFVTWPVGLREPLPTIAVPLTAAPLTNDVPAVALDLQAVLTLVYARYYAGRVDYSGPPPPPALAPDDARWAAEQVRRWA